MSNGKSLFIAALYHVDGKFSHLPRFVNLFENEFDDLKYDIDDLLNRIGEIKSDLKSKLNNCKITNDNILKVLILEELDKVEVILNDPLFALKIK